MSSSPSPAHRAPRSLPSADAIPSSLFLARTRSHKPFARSEARQQELYRGETVNRMSVFGFMSSIPLTSALPPPQYSSMRHQPPPYKAPLDIQPSPLASHPVPPPPVYERARAGTTSSRNSRSARPSMSEPPKYSSQPEGERDAKAEVIETSAEDADTEWETSGERAIATPSAERRRRDEEDVEEESGWCCGCFWAGPTKLPWQAYFIF